MPKRGALPHRHPDRRRRSIRRADARAVQRRDRRRARRGLVVTRTHARPRRAPRSGETRDVATDFGEDDLRGVFADAGDTGQQFDSRAYGCTRWSIRVVSRLGIAVAVSTVEHGAREKRVTLGEFLLKRRSIAHACPVTDPTPAQPACVDCARRRSALPASLVRTCPARPETTEVILMPPSSRRLCSRCASRLRYRTTSVR